jgi:hypothetical protein
MEKVLKVLNKRDYTGKNWSINLLGYLKPNLPGKSFFLHDVLGLGFRRIAGKLASEGIKISKDQANRLYHKYKTQNADVEEDTELKQLREAETKAQKRLRLLRQKEERRKCIAILAVEEVDAKFKHRQKLFENKKSLLRFAKNVLPSSTQRFACDSPTFVTLRRLTLPTPSKTL